MDNLNNIQNLDSILFYSGENSVVAASYTEGREFGRVVPGLGTLTKGSDGTIYFSEYPNVRYKERNTDFVNMNDLYSETLSYVISNYEYPEDMIGNTYISNNRYNVIYTYETDLNNNFDNARPIVKSNLEEFLIGLNNQKYNKQAKYGDNYEVSSIKIDQTYFRWYPENTVAYINSIESISTYTYTYYFINNVNRNIYEGEDLTEIVSYLTSREGLKENEYAHYYVDDETSYLYVDDKMTDDESIYTTGSNIDILLDAINRNKEAYNQYYHQYSYTGQVSSFTDEPYIIGGNYYSYVRQTYDTIDYMLEDKIDEKLSLFESKYQDPSIYAYYMYDCDADMKMILTTSSLGVKESTFKIGFDSRFNNWFGDVIDIHASLEAGDTIANITSYKDGEIFSIFRNKTDRITGDNVTINKNVKKIFKTVDSVDIEDTINILTPYSIDTLDLSPIKRKISNIVDLSESGWMNRDMNLKSLIFDDGDFESKSNIEKIFGLNDIKSLEYVDISNISRFARTPAIDKLPNLKVFKADGSNIDSFRPMKGINLYEVDLPGTVKSIKLVDNTFLEGEIVVGGVLKEFNGDFNYTPNDILTSLTLRNIDNKLSYTLVSNWYDAVKNANKLDSVIYLEMLGINWSSIPASRLIDIKHFDINPNLSGKISLIGTGNYKYLTRDEYQDIVRLYGVNAFIEGNDINNKVFKNLDLTIAKSRETFEFSLKVLNKSVQAYNVDKDPQNEVIYTDTLDVEFSGYYYDRGTGEEHKNSPYTNRAANALLDIIYKDNTDFTFIKDDVDNYAYCRLESSIDTSSSNEVKNIKAGDILLFNGDTLMIFFKDTVNTVYEYIKLGNIQDVSVIDMNAGGYERSTIEHWFDHNDAATLRFLPSEREKVLDKFEVEVTKDTFSVDDVEDIILRVTIDPEQLLAIDNGEIENGLIRVETNSEHLTISQNAIDEFEYKISLNFDLAHTEYVEVYVYADANREDTVIVIPITLQSPYDAVSVDGDTLVIDTVDAEVNNGVLSFTAPNGYVYDPETNTLIIN